MSEMTTNNGNTPEVTLASLSEGAVPTTNTPPMNGPVLPKFDADKVTDVNRSNVTQLDEKDMPVDGFGNVMIDEGMAQIDPTIERLRRESIDIINEGNAQRAEASLDDDEEDSKEDNNGLVRKHVRTINMPEPTPEEEEKRLEMFKQTQDEWSGSSTKIDDDDLSFLEDDDDQPDTEEVVDEEAIRMEQERIKAVIRDEMKNNFKPVEKVVDLSTFTISKKPINPGKIINTINHKEIECADSVIFGENKVIKMSRFNAVEIQSLDPRRVKSSNYNSYMTNKLKLIYDHLIDENKPSTFKAWAKATPNTTLDDYYFAAYKATFGLSNIITYSCPNTECNNVFLKARDIYDMVKFKDDDIKKKYFDILHYQNINSGNNGEYKVGIHQVSDEYAFGLKQPSLYNTYIEVSLIDDTFASKYDNLLTLISYIDSAYVIDRENNTLVPISFSPVPNDEVTTYKRKVKILSNIIQTLNSDQLQALSVITDKYDGDVTIDDNGEMDAPVKYVYPSIACPKCGKLIAEQEVMADNALFTRHQLGIMSKI